MVSIFHMQHRFGRMIRSGMGSARTNVSAQKREGNKKNVCRGNYDDDAEFSFSELPIGVDSR